MWKGSLDMNDGRNLGGGLVWIAGISAIAVLGVGLPPVAQAVPVTEARVSASAGSAKKTRTGRLHVKVQGLPGWKKAKVHIKGPAGFKKTVTKSAHLSKLRAGTYRVKAVAVAGRGYAWDASVAPKAKVKVAKGKKAKVTVSHSLTKMPGVSGGQPPVVPSWDLRFDLRNAAGIAVPESSTRSTPEPGLQPPLLAVDAQGQVSSAVVEGQIPEGVFIARTYLGPGNRLAILYAGYPTGYHQDYCLIGLVDRGTGEQTCLEMSRNGFTIQGGTGTGSNPAVQFDAQGRVYYQAAVYDQGQKNVLRRHDGVKAVDVVDWADVFFRSWLVASDGTIVASGSSPGNGQTWTRAVSPSGGIQALPKYAVVMPATFPDGNIYLEWWGPTSQSSKYVSGIVRYLVAERELEEGFWIANSDHLSEPVRWDTSAFCGPMLPNNYCSTWAPRKMVTTRSGEVWGLSNDRVIRLYPSPAVADLDLIPGTLTAAGDRLAIAGLDQHGKQTTVLYDTIGQSSTTLLDATDEVELFGLEYSAALKRIMFRGVRFSDGKYVLGTIDLPTGVTSMQPTSKVRQLLAFDD